MTPALDRKHDLLLYYQCILAVGAVILFFSDIDLYFFRTGQAPAPVMLVFLFGFASLPLLLSIFSRIDFFSAPIVTWCSSYLLVSLLSFLIFLSSDAGYQELRLRILSVLFFLIMLLIFSRYRAVQSSARYTTIIVGIMGVLNNIYELLNPLVFGGLNDTGRPAGFYVDPNRTGCALVLSMIFGTGLVPQKYRPYFIAFIGLGILLTFSRGAILGWILVILIFLKQKVITKNQLIYWLIGTGIIVIGLGLLSSNFININQLPYGVRERLEWFENPTASEHSADSRMAILIAGWQLFIQSPLWGNGIASTIDWSYRISTHNMYLVFMVDHGFLGILILPLFVYAVTYPTRGENRYVALSFAILILLWGLFSHTILEDRFILLSFALMATLNVTSQQEEKYHLRHQI
ncbi:O-antigen ligase family protein [Gloeocapsopsis sp. IPPAS B-1203]|uniref:O-antigen ligase family protein n=1 Tax=Gloeocapsopsis sp. IPPAS B-1203 TaxID=2049454 RepID=UPI000C19E590|nr:O-antigen ligase family protein [Gloeocapsopsis sp. IPPAS B-1203]PIG91486.1 hypothetical protein CSQ79_21320 [Gloeocapsopsis sp. IPPAS B-1203]